MDKLGIGLLCGLLFGGGGTFAAITFAESSSKVELVPSLAAKDEVFSDDADEKSEEAEAPAPVIDTEAPDLQTLLDERMRDERAAHDFALTKLNQQMLEKDRLIGEMQVQLSSLKAAIEADSSNAEIALLSQAERKERGVSTLATIRELLEEGKEGKIDVASILKHMETLKSLGPAAYKEFIEAYREISPKGNPYSRGGGNDLKLSMAEYDLLFSDEMIDFVLRNPNGDVEGDVQQAALWRLMSRRAIEDTEKTRMLTEVIAKGADQRSKDMAVMQLAQVDDPSAIKPLVAAIKNPELSDWSRARAIEGLAGNESSAATAELQLLASDPNKEIADQAQSAIDRRVEREKVEEVKSNIPIAGYLVESVYANSAAAVAGIQVGDIITRYNGQQISKDMSLNRAKATAQTGQSVAVDIYRNGSFMSFNIAAGTIGINGDYVEP